MTPLPRNRLPIHVQDEGARYPIRIDPTFSDADWTSIAVPGFNGSIQAAVVGSGDLYAGGSFTTAANHPAAIAYAQLRLPQATFSVTTTPSGIAYGGESVVEVSGGSGSGAVSLAITDGAAFCALDGTTVTGTCTLTATKARDATYYAATASVDIAVTKAIGAVAFDALNFTYDASTRAVTAHIAEEPATACAVPQSPIGPNAGSYPVTATCDGTHYTASGSDTATIAQASQAALVVSADPGSILFGETSVLSTAGGSGTGEVSYAATTGAANCGIVGATLTGTGLGTCTITATKAADVNYLVATATVDVNVTPKADLQLSKDANRASAMIGDTAVFTLVAANAGPNDVTGARLVDTPPGTLADVGWACVPAASSIPCPTAPNDAGEGAMDVLFDLPANQYLRYDLIGAVAGVIGAQIQNSASLIVPAGVTDPSIPNDASASVLIVPMGVFADGFENEGEALTVPGAEAARRKP